MKEQIKKIIQYEEYSIVFITNDNELYSEIISEYDYYFKFYDNIRVDERNLYKIKVLKDKKLYRLFYDNIREKKLKKDCFCEIRRENIIIIDKVRKEICVIYDEYSNKRLQHIEELILAIFGKYLEDDGYYFIHAACVAKNGEGIIILGERHSGKTSLLLEFLKNKFDFVTNAQIGIRNKKNVLEAISIPTRIGIRIESLYNTNFNDESIIEIKQSKEYLEKFSKISDKEMKDKYQESKFNLSLSELRRCFQVNLVQKVKIKGIIEPHFVLNSTKMSIKKMCIEELSESLINNKRNGIYRSVDYVKNLYYRYKSNVKLPRITTDEVQPFKIYQNSSDEKELIEFINRNDIK